MIKSLHKSTRFYPIRIQMKKYLLIAVVGLGLTLAWCGQSPQNTNENASETCSVTDSSSCSDTGSTNETKQENDANQTLETLSTNNTWEMCANVIKDYLAKADLKGKWDKSVGKWHEIVVHYVWRLNELEVFDTSVEEVAKACGKYTPARNYNEWLAFTVGAGQMIPGFDKWVEGMKIWQTKTITIPAKEAYGEWSEKNIIEVDRSQLPAGEYEKWTKLMSQVWQTFTVYGVSEKTISLDANHELAWKDLIFDITIVEIK